MSKKKPIVTNLTDYATCPYCGFVDPDSWELGGPYSDEGEAECPRCERTYWWKREHFYTTKKVEK